MYVLIDLCNGSTLIMLNLSVCVCNFIGTWQSSVARLASPARTLLRQGAVEGLLSLHHWRNPRLNPSHTCYYLPANQPSRDTDQQHLAIMTRLHTYHPFLSANTGWWRSSPWPLTGDWAAQVTMAPPSHMVMVQGLAVGGHASNRALPKHRSVNQLIRDRTADVFLDRTTFTSGRYGTLPIAICGFPLSLSIERSININ